MNLDSRILVTGHKGLVGSAIVRELLKQGYNNLYLIPRDEVDWTNPVLSRWYFSCTRPEYVFHCAARVGGIKDNIKNPLSFFLDNIRIQDNVFQGAKDYGTKKLLFLGSSCIYPKDAPKPLKEEYLLTGPFEKAVEAYGLAKACGVRLCEWYRQAFGCNFIAAMPCNVFGPFDKFDPEASHIIPGMLARMHAAHVARETSFEVWGDGSARRELVYSEDLARALIVIMKSYDGPEHINAGSGLEYSVAEISQLVRATVGFEGSLGPATSQPTGTPRKIMDNHKLFGLGWTPQVGIVEGLAQTYKYFLDKLPQP